jgi:sporulation protein YlmC with PRC-barrel domain
LRRREFLQSKLKEEPMKIRFKQPAASALLASALAVPGACALAQDQKPPELSRWDPSTLYRDTWSADEMIDTDVRGAKGEEIGEVKDIIVGADGTISKVVVEVGGFLEIGDQHIGVPWKDVRIRDDMRWVEVPLKEVESGTYSLHGRVPQGEDVAAAPKSWRVNELVGDYASLENVARYGMVTDVIFTDEGKAQGVIVDRAAGTWGSAGWYAYPYAGYYPDRYAYPLPYASAEVGDYGRFDYVLLSQQSRYSDAGNERARAQQAKGSRQQSGGASTGGSGSGQSSGERQ